MPLFLAMLEGNNEIWQEKAYLPGIAAIAMGICGALFAARVPARLRVAPMLCAVGGIGLVAALLFGPWLWRAIGNGTMLVLTTSVACLLVGLHWRQRLAPAAPMRGLGWLRAQGRLSYEIYLTHMFVVFTAIGWFRASGGDMRSGWLWYPPIVLACWALGALVARGWSEPCDRAIRRRWLTLRTDPPAMVTEVA
jgi:peptidoglycan/LPS O-acetylase OafA/YrhL